MIVTIIHAIICIGSNDCAVSPCLNGGHCIDLVGGYGCMCTEGFFGSNCGTPCKLALVNK